MNYLPRNACFVFICLGLIALFACTNNTPGEKGNAAETDAPPLPKQDAGVTISLLDKSPMDVIYFPEEYPKLKMMGNVKGPPVFRIFYSRPQKNGRTIFGNVVKYGEHWRLGANEATEIEFFSDVSIQNVKIPKGKYVLYCIPQQTEWTLILNSDLFSWGLKIDPAKDIFKFTVPVTHVNSPIEAFTMETQTNGNGALLWIGWDDTKVVLPIQIK